MSTVDLPESLLAQMGGQVWQERLKIARPIPQQAVEELGSGVVTEEVSVKVTPSQVTPSKHENKLSFILIAPGLEAIWEVEDALEWQLLQNIAQVFHWDLEQLTYFDTDLLATEEAVMATLEEVFALQVTTVFSMDSDSMLSQYFTEGFEVITLPSLEQMLSDGYAKKMCYNTLITAS